MQDTRLGPQGCGPAAQRSEPETALSGEAIPNPAQDVRVRGITVDDRTRNYSLPLPHQDNRLVDDVLRLRDGLNILDNALQSAADAAYHASDVAAGLENAWAIRFTEFSAQIVRLSARLADLEITSGPNMEPSGYEKDGAKVAPVSIVPDGTEPPIDAAIAIIVENPGPAGD